MVKVLNLSFMVDSSGERRSGEHPLSDGEPRSGSRNLSFWHVQGQVRGCKGQGRMARRRFLPVLLLVEPILSLPHL